MSEAKSHRILIIDDDPDFNLLLSDIFEFYGYDSHSETEPSEAIAQFDTQSFDLVVTDHVLPGYTSAKVIAECRERVPGIPIIVISGYLSDVDISRLKENGIENVFIKPLNLQQLVDCCKELIV